MKPHLSVAFGASHRPFSRFPGRADLSHLAASLSRRLGIKQRPQAYIVSYPKTGRTWLRALVGKYLIDSRVMDEHKLLDTETLTTKAGLRRTSLTHDGSEMVSATHFADLVSDKSGFAETRVLLLGRDVRDTMVSAFFQATRRVDVFEGTISEFIRSDRFGVRKFITFYEHWVAGRNMPESFLFLDYESLHSDPAAALTGTLAFFGERSVNDQAVASSVAFCAFDSLRRAEEQNQFGSEILSPADDNDPDSYKVRRGIVGGYKDYLSDADIVYIDEQIARTGFDFGRFKD